jgi:hypothetical protein
MATSHLPEDLEDEEGEGSKKDDKRDSTGGADSQLCGRDLWFKRLCGAQL